MDFDTIMNDVAFIPLESLVTLASCRPEGMFSGIDDPKWIGPGDDLFYVGRFADHAGKYENLPSVRFGSLSMMPNEREPVEYDIDGKTFTQVGFLVEARSRSGYSGSPVFLYYGKYSADHDAIIVNPDKIQVLGVDWGHLPERVTLRDPGGHLDGAKRFVEIHAGMMGVVPSWYLKDFIEQSPELTERRDHDDSKRLLWHPGGVVD
jgi:hypothetical protein